MNLSNIADLNTGLPLMLGHIDLDGSTPMGEGSEGMAFLAGNFVLKENKPKDECRTAFYPFEQHCRKFLHQLAQLLLDEVILPKMGKQFAEIAIVPITSGTNSAKRRRALMPKVEGVHPLTTSKSNILDLIGETSSAFYHCGLEVDRNPQGDLIVDCIVDDTEGWPKLTFLEFHNYVFPEVLESVEKIKDPVKRDRGINLFAKLHVHGRTAYKVQLSNYGCAFTPLNAFMFPVRTADQFYDDSFLVKEKYRNRGPRCSADTLEAFQRAAEAYTIKIGNVLSSLRVFYDEDANSQLVFRSILNASSPRPLTEDTLENPSLAVPSFDEFRDYYEAITSEKTWDPSYAHIRGAIGLPVQNIPQITKERRLVFA